MRSRSLCLVLTGVLCAAAPARCDDFLTSGSSDRATALGGVYAPSSTNALDALAINPAGLALRSAPVIDLSIEAVFARGQFVNRANPNGRLDANGAVPYGAIGAPLGRRWGFGAAVLPELLSSAKWRYTDPPGGAGQVSYGPLNSTSQIVALRAALGVGFYVSPRFQLGAGFGTVYNANTLQTAYVFQTTSALAGLKTLLDLHTKGFGVNGSIGVLSSPTDRVQLGAAYKSRTTIRSTGVATGNAGVQSKPRSRACSV